MVHFTPGNIFSHDIVSVFWEVFNHQWDLDEISPYTIENISGFDKLTLSFQRIPLLGFLRRLVVKLFVFFNQFGVDRCRPALLRGVILVLVLILISVLWIFVLGGRTFEGFDLEWVDTFGRSTKDVTIIKEPGDGEFLF